MSFEKAIPLPFNPVHDPIAAAQQMALAIIVSGQYRLPQSPADAAEASYKLLNSVTERYFQFRTAYQGR